MSALPPKATAKADSRKRRASNGPRFQFGLQARTYLLKQRCCGEARGLSDKINFRNGMTAAIPEAGRTDGHVEFLTAPLEGRPLTSSSQLRFEAFWTPGCSYPFLQGSNSHSSQKLVHHQALGWVRYFSARHLRRLFPLKTPIVFHETVGCHPCFSSRFSRCVAVEASK